jgi:hypothetical protein
LKETTDALRLAPAGFEPVANVLGLIGLALFVRWLYRIARREQ